VATSNTKMQRDDVSSTLAMNELVVQMRDSGRTVFHMGFGEAPFPAHPRLVESLRNHSTQKRYLPVAGLPALRSAVAGHYARLTGISTGDFDVMIGPGSKTLLFALQMCIPGDVLLPVPSWVSYAPQAALLHQNVIPVDVELSDAGLSIDAKTLRLVISKARADGMAPSKMILNYPSNPTGLTVSDAALASIAEVCRSEKIILIADEIYGRLAYDHRYRSAVGHLPESTVITTGLSKHLSVGGWRLGVSLIPKAAAGLFNDMCRVASETWSCVSTPIQYAAIDAYLEHPDIEDFVRQTTDIHACVNRYIAEKLRGLGAECHTPQGGFYNWPDFTTVLGHACDTSDELARRLLEEHGVATLAGSAFGERPDKLCLRLSGCDYDGGTALELWPALGKSPDEFVARAAPNVIAALGAIEKFVGERSR
jgi:aspartate aminotransferase